MGWKECDRVSLRREFVCLAAVEGANVAELCRRFGIARKTGYKCLGRYRALGVADVPAASTITGILRRHGQIADAASRQRQPFQRFERTDPTSCGRSISKASSA